MLFTACWTQGKSQNDSESAPDRRSCRTSRDDVMYAHIGFPAVQLQRSALSGEDTRRDGPVDE